MNAVDTNILIYVNDPRNPDKQAVAASLIPSLTEGVRTYALYKFLILCIDENTSFQALINYPLINSDRLKRVEKSRFNA